MTKKQKNRQTENYTSDTNHTTQKTKEYAT